MWGGTWTLVSIVSDLKLRELLAAVGHILRFKIFNYISNFYTFLEHFRWMWSIQMGFFFLRRNIGLWWECWSCQCFRVLHLGARLTLTEGEAAFHVNAKASRHSWLSVLCVNNDSSLQVGRTWQRAPITNRLPPHQHTPPKSLWNLPSVTNFTLWRQSCEQLRAHNSLFCNSFLNLQTSFYSICSTF